MEKKKDNSIYKVEVKDTIEDCYRWRKYGQKLVHDSKFPRCYYRCTYAVDEWCNAKKQVEQLEDESNKFRITYIGHHICKRPHYENVTAPHHQEPGQALNYQHNPLGTRKLPTRKSNVIQFHQDPGQVLDFGGSKNQRILTTNATPVSEECLPAMSDDLNIDFIDNEDDFTISSCW